MMLQRDDYLEYITYLWKIYKECEITRALRGDNTPIPVQENYQIHVLPRENNEYLFRFHTCAKYIKPPKKGMTLSELEKAIIRDAPNIKSIQFIIEKPAPIII